MEVNEQSVKLFSDKLYSFLNYILPGVFILEVFFDKGIFSNSPQTIFEFLLFLVWAFIFSIPYNLIDTFSMGKYAEKLKKEFSKQIEAKEEYEKEFQKIMEESEEEFLQNDSLVQFVFINLYLIFTYLISKYLSHNYSFENIYNINEKLILFANSILIFYLIPFPIIYFFTRLIEFKIIKAQIKR